MASLWNTQADSERPFLHCREVPHCPTCICYQRGIRLIRQMEHLTTLFLGMGFEPAPLYAVIGTMTFNAVDIIECAPLRKRIAEIIKTAFLVQPIHVEHHHGTMKGMLTDGRQHLARSYFYKLRLMDTTVDSTAIDSIIGVIAHGVHIKFTKTCPRLAVIIGHSYVSHVAVGENIIPDTIRPFFFRQRSSIAPEK